MKIKVKNIDTKIYNTVNCSCNHLNETIACMKSDEISIMKYGTHLAEKVGGERLSGDEAVSKTTSLPQKEVKYRTFCHGSEHFDQIILQF